MIGYSHVPVTIAQMSAVSKPHSIVLLQQPSLKHKSSGCDERITLTSQHAGGRGVNSHGWGNTLLDKFSVLD